jgi:hypothetical protein
MIIGLIGEPRAGKDEVANFLVKHYDFKKIAFADQIKKEYFIKTGLTINSYEKLKRKGQCGDVREGLWAYSKLMKDANGQDYFIKVVLNKINQDAKWVITDIRTKLELEMVLEKKAEIILVNRSKLNNKIKESELVISDVTKFDIINNNQSIEELNSCLTDFFKRKFVDS